MVHRSSRHPDWLEGWAVVKGADPRWEFAGIYDSRTKADEAAAKAGEGYHVRWGFYDERTKEFITGGM